MPGTTMLDAYEMTFEDALAIMLVADDDVLLFRGLTLHEIDELHRAARAVVEGHAVEVAHRYITRPEPENSFRVLQGGKSHNT